MMNLGVTVRLLLFYCDHGGHRFKLGNSFFGCYAFLFSRKIYKGHFGKMKKDFRGW